MSMHHSRRYWRTHQYPRPEWWPENLPWPPRRRERHNPFFRMLGCAFSFFFLLFGLAFLVGILVLVVHDLGLSNMSLSVFRWVVLLGTIFLILFITIIFVTGVEMRRISGPLDELLDAAERVGEGDTSIHVDEKGPRAVRSLARAFNEMASRLHDTDEQRRALLADVTHELRTPLTVVQGNLEGMLDGVYPADETNLRSLLEETKLLERLVDDLRTLALAESGALQLKKEPTDLAALVRETAAAFRSKGEAAGVSLTVEAAEALSPVTLDPGRIRQVLSNLLANALRYTPSSGFIRLHYDQADGQARIDVQDSGPGIPAEDLPHVFERFHKSTDAGGMGLGLAIARRLVEAHGGMIHAESTPDQGTTIHISLPVQ